MRAVESYRARGYGIAMGGGAASLGAGLMQRIRPDIARIGPGLPGASLHAFCGRVHAMGAHTLTEGASTGLRHAGALATDIDLVQAYLPDTLRQPWMAEKSLAA